MANGADRPTGVDLHVQALGLELDWLGCVLDLRLRTYFELRGFDCPLPTDLPPDSALANLVQQHSLGTMDRLVLALALAPHLRPEALDLFFMRNQNLDRGYTEFGGWGGEPRGGFLPTGETAAFLVAAGSLADRIRLLECFGQEHPFAALGVFLKSPDPDEPRLNGRLLIRNATITHLTTGEPASAGFSRQS